MPSVVRTHQYTGALAQTEVSLSLRVAFVQLNWTMSGTLREVEKHHSDLRHQSGLLMSVCLVWPALCKQTRRADLKLWPTC